MTSQASGKYPETSGIFAQSPAHARCKLRILAATQGEQGASRHFLRTPNYRVVRQILEMNLISCDPRDIVALTFAPTKGPRWG
jgi:hypothetical protein